MRGVFWSKHRVFWNKAQSIEEVILNLGQVLTLVIYFAESAREIMKNHDLAFASRPDSGIPRRLLCDYRDVSQAPYGEYWRQVRSICVLHLLITRRIQLFRHVREEETGLLLRKIEERSCSGSDPDPIDLTAMLASLTDDVVCRVAFGRKYNVGVGGRRFKELLVEFACAALCVCCVCLCRFLVLPG